jgi:hypothetical protein
MSEKSLPEKYRVRTRQELEELASSPEPTKRGVLGGLLRELGFQPSDILELKSKERVELILKTQEERGGSVKEEAPAASAKGKASGAAQVPAKEKASPPAAQAAPAQAAAPAPAGFSTAALEKKIAELQAVTLEQGKALAKVTQILLDTHYQVRLLVASNPDTNANAKDPEIREMLYGKLSDEGND